MCCGVTNKLFKAGRNFKSGVLPNSICIRTEYRFLLGAALWWKIKLRCPADFLKHRSTPLTTQTFLQYFLFSLENPTVENPGMNLVSNAYKILNLKLQKVRNIFDGLLQSFFSFHSESVDGVSRIWQRIFGQCVCESWLQCFLLFHWWFFHFHFDI